MGVTKIVNLLSRVKMNEKQKYLSSEFCDGKQEIWPHGALKKAFPTFLLHRRGHVHYIAQFLERILHFQKLVKMFISKK